MTMQEAYETMRKWMTRRGASRAWDEGIGSCMYLTKDLNKCAVGAVLSPEALEEISELEGNVNAIQDGDGHAAKEVQEIGVDFLYSAQIIHDKEESWDEYGFKPQKLDELALNFGLTVPAPSSDEVGRDYLRAQREGGELVS